MVLSQRRLYENNSEGIHFFEKHHLLYYDKNKLAREDHKTVNITHEYDFSASSRLAEDIFPKLKPCVDEYLQAFGVLGLRKFLLHDIKLKEIPFWWRISCVAL